jgi:flavodoxin
VDAVSYASQNVTGEKLVGTAQMVAGWIADETGGDVFPIQTACAYPEAFWDTVTVIEGQEKDHVHPRMAAIPEDMTGYDTVWLVTPIWAYSVCLPVRSFLESVDLSGRTVYVFTTHCGSGMADAMEVVQALQPNANVRKGMAIASDTFDGIREQVLQFVQGIQD